MWLAQGYEPTYRTINRFRTNPLVADFLIRKSKYQRDMEIFKDRNSNSKTDHDATFMRMKDDYMMNG